MDKKKVSQIKEYFLKRKDIVLAFIFGSKVKGEESKISDWDIGVYFKPEKKLEIEETKNYPQAASVWADLADILKTDNIDLVVLNRAPLNIVASILREGRPLVVKDEDLFLKILIISLKISSDYREFVDRYYEIYQKANSLSASAKERLKKIVLFLEEELTLYEYFQKFSYKDYEDIHKRHEVERWVENLINSAIDIGEIILASNRIKIPDYYREIFLKLANFDEFKDVRIDKFGEWVRLRNILAHEYLDIKWDSIKRFIEESREYFERFLQKVKEIISKS